ncbi:MAG: S41 family peptidase, partial [Planctomycetes bacterium]|nr:S41 family peptidase [Planctomycetota bacterium]
MNRRTSVIVQLALWLGLALAPWALSSAGPPPVPPAADFEQTLSQGFDLERSGHWSRAVQLYEDATKIHPDSQLLRERLRHCQIHYGLARRYHDSSFRSQLLALPRTRALRLYDEVSQKVEENYVEPPELSKLFHSGIDNLLVACDDESFIKANLPNAKPEQISRFRDQLRRWKNLNVRDRAEARRQVASVTALAESWLGIQPAPVILEFISGECDALDDYSSFLTPDHLNELYSVIDGSFVGIGVELQSDDDGLLVVNVLSGGPAAEAGVRGKDHIVAVDSIPTVGLPTEEAANLLQGKEGTSVQLWIRSPAESDLRRLVLRRRALDVQSVPAAHLISPAEGIGYVQISAFQKSTLSELEAAVAKLEQQGMRGLILDLRGNPGGLLTSAVEVSDKFLTDGVIVSTRGRAEGQTYTHRAHRAQTWTFPLVLLIDNDSASASEIVAGAIQDNRRGTIVGARSHGKGSVQSVFPLDAAGGLRLTTAKFFSPYGRAYAGQGVSPDIEVRRGT